MEPDQIRLIIALIDLNSALFTGLETALLVMDKWEIMPVEKKEDIITTLRLLVENNRGGFTDKPTLH